MQLATGIAFSGFVSGAVIVIGRRYLSGVLWHPRSCSNSPSSPGLRRLCGCGSVANRPRPETVLNWRERLGLDGGSGLGTGDSVSAMNESERYRMAITVRLSIAAVAVLSSIWRSSGVNNLARHQGVELRSVFAEVILSSAPLIRSVVVLKSLPSHTRVSDAMRNPSTASSISHDSDC